jgi:hypothetical protein
MMADEFIPTNPSEIARQTEDAAWTGTDSPTDILNRPAVDGIEEQEEPIGPPEVADDPNDPEIVLVNGEPILRTEYQQRVASANPDDLAREALVRKAVPDAPIQTEQGT